MWLTALRLDHAPHRGDKEYPPSTVLGIGKGVSSGVFGITSGIALIVGLYCVAQSNLLNILSGSTVNGWYVAGSLLVPYCKQLSTFEVCVRRLQPTRPLPMPMLTASVRVRAGTAWGLHVASWIQKQNGKVRCSNPDSSRSFIGSPLVTVGALAGCCQKLSPCLPFCCLLRGPCLPLRQ